MTGVHFWPWPDQYISRNSQDFRRRQSCRHGRQGGRRRPPRALLRRPPGQGAHAEKVPEYSNFPYLPFSTIPCFSMVWCCYFLGGVGWVERRSLRRREGRDEEGEIGNPSPPFVAVRITPRLGTCPTFGLNFCASSDTQWIPADSCGFLRIPGNS